jgi:hypothetical protein
LIYFGKWKWRICASLLVDDASASTGEYNMRKVLNDTSSVSKIAARIAPRTGELPALPLGLGVSPHLSPYLLPPQTGPPLLAYTTHEAAKISGICRSLLYREIAAGRLIARKHGRRTIILGADLWAWLESLPRMPVAKPAREAAAVVLNKTADAGREGEAS